MAVPPQRDLRQLVPAHPLMDVAAARGALRCSEDEVLEMIDHGALAWAWNIATKKADRRYIKILTRCVADYNDRSRTDLDWPTVIRFLIPDTKPFLPTASLATYFLCDKQHTVNLANEGSLSVMPGSAWRPGNGGSPLVSRVSVIEFLKARRIQ